MATVDDCHDALERLAERLAQVDDHERRKHAFDRTISCHVPDLDLTFYGELREGHLRDITTKKSPRAQIRLTTKSDDLVAMTDGHLSFGQAWLKGKVKVEASVFDLLKLRSLL
ncbi:MAG TPA: alkyl sulfatase C-terminal domain-containing protein [Actinomycetes bacterium]